MVFAFKEPPRAKNKEHDENEKKTAWERIKEYRSIFSSVTVAMLTIQFVQIFNQLTLETVLTPLTLDYFGFGQLCNSLVYAAITVLLISVYIVIIFLTKRFSDRSIIIFAQIFEGISLIYFLSWYYSHDPSWKPELYQFMIGMALWALGMPFYMVCSPLYSKFIEKDKQGMGQSFFGMVTALGQIGAPLWAGASLELGGFRITLLMSAGLWCLLTFLIVLNFKKMYIPVVRDDLKGTEKENLIN